MEGAASVRGVDQFQWIYVAIGRNQSCRCAMKRKFSPQNGTQLVKNGLEKPEPDPEKAVQRRMDRVWIFLFYHQKKRERVPMKSGFNKWRHWVLIAYFLIAVSPFAMAMERRAGVAVSVSEEALGECAWKPRPRTAAPECRVWFVKSYRKPKY